MLSENIDAVQKRISEAAVRAGRDPSTVKLLAATKAVPVARIREAISYGLKLFGENYVQEARAKIEEVDPGVSWHFIGRLQTNKAKYAVRLFDLMVSIYRICGDRFIQHPAFHQMQTAQGRTLFGQRMKCFGI